MALNATFVADFSSFTDATKAATGAVTEFKQAAGEVGPALAKPFAEQVANAEQVGKAVKQLGTDVIASSAKFVTAYSEQQEVVNRLNIALEATGQYTPRIAADYLALAAQFQDTTKYASGAIIEIEAIFTTIGRLGPEQMGLALEATTNLASALKIDLDSAANMVAKSIAKGNEPVGKLKTLLAETAVEGWSTADMLKAINTRVGKAAAGELETYNGQVEHMKNELSDFNETVGKVIVDNLSGLLKAFQALPEPIQKAIISVGTITTAIAPVLTSLEALIRIIGAAGLGAAFLSMGIILGSVGIAIVGFTATATLYWHKAGDQAKELLVIVQGSFGKIPAIMQQTYEGIKRWLVDGLQNLVAMIRSPIDQIIYLFRLLQQTVVGGSIVPDMMRGIAAEFRQLDAIMVAPVRAAAADAARAFGGLGASAPGLGGLAAGGGGTVVNISMTGMLGANDPQTRQAISQVVGDALAQSMRGQRLLSSA